MTENLNILLRDKFIINGDYITEGDRIEYKHTKEGYMLEVASTERGKKSR